jgi:hypothetical protein
MYSQLTLNLPNFTTNSQWTHWVYGWVSCDHIAGQIMKELLMSGSRHVVGKLRTNCERTLRVLSKSYPLGTLMGSFRSISQLTQWSNCGQSGGQVLIYFKTYPLGNVWVNCWKTLKKLSIYPPGNTPSAPSVRRNTVVCWDCSPCFR